MKKILLGLILGCSIIGANAQQEAQYTQYMVNPYLINPALAGVEDMIDIKTGHRQQWLGFNDNNTSVGENHNSSVAPQTTYLSAHTPIGKPHYTMHYKGEHQNWHGVGGKIVMDKTGPTSWSSYLLNYSYNMGLIKPKGSGIYTKGGLRMSAGFFYGLQQYKLDASSLRYGTGTDENPLNGEGSVGNGFSKTKQDATLGIWLYDTKNELYYVGVSMNHILGGNLRISDFLSDSSDKPKSDPSLARHIFLTAGTTFELTNEWDWKPSVLVKFVSPGQTAIDLNSRFEWNKMVWGGVSYRHLDALSIAAGAVINYMFEVAYSYDFTTTEIRTYGSNGTHELTLGIRLAPHGHNSNAEDHWR